MNDDDDILAAEFALGLLDVREAEAMLTRLRTDDALSLRVAWWRDQLSPLAREVETPPPTDLWPRIAARLPANDAGVRLMKRWRAAALGAMAVAAAIVLVVLGRPQLPAPGPVSASPMVAMLSSDPGKPALVMIGYERATGMMTIAPAALDPGRGDAELWAIPADGKPRSMGVIDPRGPQMHNVPMPKRAMMVAGVTFAVSYEPKGGSPTGSPTGPVMASGKIVDI